MEEYVRVFEPLLFEECRAQLYSTYEELPGSVSRDTYFTVRVKMVERRERGLLPFILFIYFHFLTTYDKLFFVNYMAFTDQVCRNHISHICNVGFSSVDVYNYHLTIGSIMSVK